MADSIDMDDIDRIEFLAPDMIIAYEIENQMSVPATIGKPVSEDLHAFLTFKGARKRGTKGPHVVNVAIPIDLAGKLAHCLLGSIKEAEEYRDKLRAQRQQPSSEKPQGD